MNIRSASVSLPVIALFAASVVNAAHPLDPLSASEIETAVRVINADARAGQALRFATIDLAEPDKTQVFDDLKSGTLRRSARAIAYDWATGTMSDIVVDLGSGQVIAWRSTADTEPPMRRLVISRLNEIAKGDPQFRAAMAGAGVEDLGRMNLLASVDEDAPLTLRNGERYVTGNPYMFDERLEGKSVPVAVVANLTRGELVDISRRPGRWTPSDRTAPERGRAALAPLEIDQPEGAGFMLDGHEIRWQNWRINYGVHPRRGLELHDIRYTDDGRERRILYRASVSETITPYGDPEWVVWYPLDEGDYGLGTHGIRSAVPGADAPANAVFRSATLHDHLGNPHEIERAVTIYERYGGMLWRHADESAPSRELVIAYYTTIDNYDYAFNWIFRQDGKVEVEAQLSGIINYGRTNRTSEPAFETETRSHRTIVAPGITGPIHQHYFSYRLDFDVDGAANTLVEVQTDGDPVGPGNPDGNWFSSVERVLPSESQARRRANPARGRTWRIVNEGELNAYGRPVGYALVPARNVLPAPDAGAPSRQKMQFMNWHLWATAFDPAEMHAGGDFLQPGVRGGGLPVWTEADRPLRDRDLVVWYTLGMTHVVRPEDWPIMPVHTSGFEILPFGFFDANPAMDVPAVIGPSAGAAPNVE